MAVTTDQFKEFAKQVANEELERSKRKATSTRDYEEIKWVGIPEAGKGVKIIRGLGGIPNSNVTPYTSRTIRHATIKADNGKDVKIVLPLGPDAEDHFMWRVINRVMEVDWVNKKKYFVNQTKHPDIFNMVEKNSYAPGTNQHKFDKGWAGRDVFIMNCIDRDPEVYKWSREKKHTVLLSKEVRVSPDKDGNLKEWPTVGVPAFGFANILPLNIFKYYGDWNFYDLCIEKTGITTSPYKIANAFKHIEEVPEAQQGWVVDGPLTEEELSWEQYDLSKLFHVTYYTKIFNRLNKSIAKIDDVLGTSFLSELKSLVEDEKKTMESEKPSAEEEEDAEFPSEPLPSAPVEESAPVELVTRNPVSKEFPKGYSFLNTTERELITSMKHIKDNEWEISYNTEEALAKCNVCGTPSPSSFSTCPGCGSTF